MSDEPVQVEAEATGETVGEAKWAVLRELERLVPGLDRDAVEFQVLSEGERGLLGVGFVEARVIGRVVAASRGPARAPLPSLPPSDDAAGTLQDVLTRICAGLGVDARVTVDDRDGVLRGAIAGADIGLMIGKHGQTIDAIQHLAQAVVARVVGERVELEVDAGGYRDRRRATLEGIADRAAERALETGSPVVLDPMSSGERKVIHLRLKEREDVVSSSEGYEPSRCVVVSPAE